MQRLTEQRNKLCVTAFNYVKFALSELMKYSQLTYLNMYLIIVIVSVKHILNFT